MTDTVVVKFIPAEHWWKRAKWELVEDYTSANGEVTVPKGFISDGASIPFFATSYFSATGRYFGAAIIHDYLIVVEKNWDKANDQFNKEMRALGIDSWRRYIMMWSVNLWKHVRS